MAKIALACDWLTTPGGAEKLLLELHKMYPDAPIYTSQYRPKKLDWFNDATVKTGWLNIFPAGLRKLLGPFRQLYFSHLDLSEYDVVISVTGAEAKSIRTRSKDGSAKAYHICYCHVPTQYYWQMYDQYLANPGFGILNPLVRLGLKIMVGPLRKADQKSAQRPDQFVTISEYAKEQIRKYYHRRAKIIYPPVDVEKFAKADKPVEKPVENSQKDSASNLAVTRGKSPREQNHPSSSKLAITEGKSVGDEGKTELGSANSEQPPYITVCRQVTWKRIDLAIEACKKMNEPLKVVGDGAEHDRLVSLASGSKNIEFVSWLPSEQVAEQLHQARAYLFPSMEPFGIAAVEALAAGCPVIAYAEGGSRDFVTDGENGVLFSKQTVESLIDAIKRFERMHFDREQISHSAERFDTKHFQEGIENLVKKVEKDV